MSIRRLKGSSIAEMIIVIAVISIISTIVLSFVVVSNETVRSSSSKVDALNDIAVVETFVDNWIKEKKDNGYTLVKKDDYPNSIFSTKEGQEIELTIENKELVEKENKVITKTLYASSTVEFIEFSINSKADQELIICHVTYETILTNNKTKDNQYTFTSYLYNYLQGGNSNEENN